MVFESLTNPFEAEQHPVKLFFLGFLYASIALFLSLWVFKENAGLVMVFFAVMASLPLFYNTMKYEEEKDLVIFPETKLLKEHGKAIMFFMFLFLGMTLAFALWYVILPASLTTQVFESQTSTIANLNQQVTGNTAENLFVLSKIFLNNVKVMIFALFFAFIYGSGAIFIITWNASVIGTAMGNFIRTHIVQFADSIGLQQIGAYMYVSSLSLLRYFVHGIPEILAYFIAGLAGGILSVAIINKQFKPDQFEKILFDFSDLVLIAVVILFVAAVIEVYLTPLLI